MTVREMPAKVTLESSVVVRLEGRVIFSRDPKGRVTVGAWVALGGDGCEFGLLVGEQSRFGALEPLLEDGPLEALEVGLLDPLEAGPFEALEVVPLPLPVPMPLPMTTPFPTFIIMITPFPTPFPVIFPVAVARFLVEFPATSAPMDFEAFDVVPFPFELEPFPFELEPFPLELDPDPFALPPPPEQTMTPPFPFGELVPLLGVGVLLLLLLGDLLVDLLADILGALLAPFPLPVIIFMAPFPIIFVGVIPFPDIVMALMPGGVAVALVELTPLSNNLAPSSFLRRLPPADLWS